MRVAPVLRSFPSALFFGALLAPVLVAALLPAVSAAQGADGAAGSLRPYWHVFLAYAVVWILVAGWVLHIARRLRRIEARLDG